MTTIGRSAARMVIDLAQYSLRTGRWWLPAILVVLAVAAVTAAAIQAVVPTLVYALF